MPVQTAYLRPYRGRTAFIQYRRNQLFIVVFPAGGLFQEFDGLVHLLHHILQFILVQRIIRADRHIDAEVGNALILCYMLVPLGMAAADVVLEGEIRMGVFPPEGELVQVHRAPIVAHIGA